MTVSQEAEWVSQGTWVCKELVYAYDMWISLKFHLQVIRAFDQMVMQDLQPAKPKPQSDTIDADQQAMLLQVLNHRAAEELPELQQAVKNITASQFEQAFGCSLVQLPKDKRAEEISLILNAPLEGELLPAGFASGGSNLELTAEMQQISRGVGCYYYKGFGNSFMDGQLILDELSQYVPCDVHALLKQLNQELVTG